MLRNTRNKINQPVKQKFYYKVFSTKFNFDFKVPSKCTFCICDDEKRKNCKLTKNFSWRVLIGHKNGFKSWSRTGFWWDLCRYILTSLAHYKMDMYIYNLGIHSLNAKTGLMHVRDETESGRDSQDIASCIVKHCQSRKLSFDSFTW